MIRRPTHSRRDEGGQLSSADEHVRVVIAEHDGLARSMMREALGDADGIVTVATTGVGREALELVRYYRPRVLILDTALLSDDGVELIGQMLLASPATRVLTISIDDDETALAALRAGAVGHLTKDIDPEKLGRLVAHAAAGEAVVPRRLTKPLLERLRQVPDTGWRPLHSRLTTREWEIVELLGGGATTHDVAERLVLSPTTVYSHVKSLLRKLGVHSRRDAIAAARRLRREEALGQESPQPIPARSTRPSGSYGNHDQREVPAATGSDH
jgi:two-component system nitrate/nitrite response regulator NarL